MKTPSALIAEDEAVLRDELRAHLEALWPELKIVAQASNGIEALFLLKRLKPDVVFLDIQMPGLTGIEVARQAEGRCHVVFVTAYDAHAVAAFEQGAVDYVLKPAERERLTLTVQRIKKRLALRANPAAPEAGASVAPSGEAGARPNLQLLLQNLSAQLNPNAPPHLRWIQATVGQTIQMIPVEDVLFFISDEKYTRVQTAALEALIRKPIKELVDELDANLFWQIHRSTLVNTRAISGVIRDARGRQLVSVKGNAEKLEVSRSFSGLFKGM